MFKKFKKSYEIITSRSFEDILADIKKKAEEQNKNKALLLFEPVDYRKLKIQENKIEVERMPNPFNPFKGNGIITFEFNVIDSGIHINCTCDPILSQIWFGFGFFALIFACFLLIVLLTSNYIFLIFFLIFGAFAFGFAYLLVSFNSSNLEYYSKTILYDLNVISKE